MWERRGGVRSTTKYDKGRKMLFISKVEVQSTS